MRATAKWNYVKVSPQKARLVADRVRRLGVDAALTALRHINKRTAAQIQKVLESAVANADDRGANVDDLVIESIYVNEGPRAKRMRPAPMGRSHRYVHRMSHIVVTVSDGRPDEIDEEEGASEQHARKGD